MNLVITMLVAAVLGPLGGCASQEDLYTCALIPWANDGSSLDIQRASGGAPFLDTVQKLDARLVAAGSKFKLAEGQCEAQEDSMHLLWRCCESDDKMFCKLDNSGGLQHFKYDESDGACCEVFASNGAPNCAEPFNVLRISLSQADKVYKANLVLKQTSYDPNLGMLYLENDESEALIERMVINSTQFLSRLYIRKFDSEFFIGLRMKNSPLKINVRFYAYGLACYINFIRGICEKEFAILIPEGLGYIHSWPLMDACSVERQLCYGGTPDQPDVLFITAHDMLYTKKEEKMNVRLGTLFYWWGSRYDAVSLDARRTGGEVLLQFGNAHFQYAKTLFEALCAIGLQLEDGVGWQVSNHGSEGESRTLTFNGVQLFVGTALIPGREKPTFALQASFHSAKQGGGTVHFVLDENSLESINQVETPREGREDIFVSVKKVIHLPLIDEWGRFFGLRYRIYAGTLVMSLGRKDLEKGICQFWELFTYVGFSSFREDYIMQGNSTLLKFNPIYEHPLANISRPMQICKKSRGDVAIYVDWLPAFAYEGRITVSKNAPLTIMEKSLWGCGERGSCVFAHRVNNDRVIYRRGIMLSYVRTGVPLGMGADKGQSLFRATPYGKSDSADALFYCLEKDGQFYLYWKYRKNIFCYPFAQSLSAIVCNASASNGVRLLVCVSGENGGEWNIEVKPNDECSDIQFFYECKEILPLQAGVRSISEPVVEGEPPAVFLAHNSRIKPPTYYARPHRMFQARAAYTAPNMCNTYELVTQQFAANRPSYAPPYY